MFDLSLEIGKSSSSPSLIKSILNLKYACSTLKSLSFLWLSSFSVFSSTTFLVNGYTVTNKDDSITTLLEPLLEDDDRLHLSSGNNSFFTPIKEGETRKLVFYIYKDTRPIWKQFLKS